MTKRQIHNLSDQELLALYRQSAVDHGAATVRGDYKSGNKAADMIIALYEEMKKRGVVEILLMKLISDIDSNVRVWATTHLLPFQPQVATKILEETSANDPSIFGFNAKIVLEQWKKGELNF